MAVLERLDHQVEDPLVSKLFHSSPQWLLYVRFWQPDTLQFDTPHLIWQSPNPVSTVIVDGCEVAADGTGYFCIIEVPSINEVSWDYVKVAFLSSGSVTDVNVISDDTEETSKSIYGIRQLPYGGFLFMEFILNYTDLSVEHNAIVKDNNGTTIATFSLTDTNTDLHSDFAIFPNNTMWVGGLALSNLVITYLPLPKLLPEGE